MSGYPGQESPPDPEEPLYSQPRHLWPFNEVVILIKINRMDREKNLTKDIKMQIIISVICLPPTLAQCLYGGKWFLGLAACKLVPTMQVLIIMVIVIIIIVVIIVVIVVVIITIIAITAMGII